MDAEDTRRYKVQIGATASDKDFQFLHGDEYDALFAVPSLPI
jgi:hypothetical protein